MTQARRSPEPHSNDGDGGLTSTVTLLQRFKQGDQEALTLLLERSLPPLRRWARGRLPQWARQIEETQDLVQSAVIRAMPRLQGFEARHPGALQAYLRQAVMNHIRDEIRKVSRHGAETELADDLPDPGPSPLQAAIGRERFERYEAALAALRPIERDAIIARLEWHQSYEEVAAVLGKPNADAARVAVARAVQRLITEMAKGDAAKGLP